MWFPCCNREQLEASLCFDISIDITGFYNRLSQNAKIATWNLCIFRLYHWLIGVNIKIPHFWPDWLTSATTKINNTPFFRFLRFKSNIVIHFTISTQFWHHKISYYSKLKNHTPNFIFDKSTFRNGNLKFDHVFKIVIINRIDAIKRFDFCLSLKNEG